MNIGLTVHIGAQRSPDSQNISEEFEYHPDPCTVIGNPNAETANNLPSQLKEGKHFASGYMITIYIYIACIYTNSNLVSEASVPTTDALSSQEGIIMFVH